jgi:hypothetical protein
VNPEQFCLAYRAYAASNGPRFVGRQSRYLRLCSYLRHASELRLVLVPRRIRRQGGPTKSKPLPVGTDRGYASISDIAPEGTVTRQEPCLMVEALCAPWLNRILIVEKFIPAIHRMLAVGSSSTKKVNPCRSPVVSQVEIRAICAFAQSGNQYALPRRIIAKTAVLRLDSGREDNLDPSSSLAGRGSADGNSRH